MKHIFTTFLLMVFSINLQADTKPLYDLVERLIPSHKSHFLFEEQPAQEHDFFELSSKGNKILIRGNSPVSMANGLNWYLKYYCNTSFSWCGNQNKLSKKLPALSEKVYMETPLQLGFYLNYCTFSYSMAFWKWEDWEREIDRMALNGITTPMAIIGVESVWRNTLLQFGYTEQEILKFLPGPAYMGWFLMGNLEGMGGPIPTGWYERQEELQKKILKRMAEYKMQPVFQGFFGMVPADFSTKFPEADVIAQGKWMNYTRPAILNPIDPLFEEMAAVWYEEYEKLYGKTSYYGGDLFHEGGKSNNIDVTEAAAGVQECMQKSVPGSTWVLQSWGGNPTPELLKGLDRKHTVVVDLCAEYWDRWQERGAFEEFPWVWANITNWGGNIGLHGRMDAIMQEPIRAQNDQKAGKWLKGIGNVPEGIGTNPVIFDLACEMRWLQKEPDPKIWLEKYAGYRYGKENEVLNQAWNIFYNTAYGTYKGHRRPSESVFCARPSLKVKSASAWGSSKIYYKEDEFEEGVKLFVSQKDKFKDCDSYNYDLVDFTRQLMSNKGRTCYQLLMNSFKNNQADSVSYYSGKFLELIQLQDNLLACRPEFKTATWLDQARSCVSDPDAQNLFEYNARTLITTWSTEKSSLVDYAHREWSGLLRDYYYPRWSLFCDWLQKKLVDSEIPEPDYFIIEEQWTQKQQESPYPQLDLWKTVEECINFTF